MTAERFVKEISLNDNNTARVEVGLSGWWCRGCHVDTLSRCLTCQEPNCGNCLPVHECEGAS